MLWLNRDMLGNTVLRWLIAAGIVAGGTALARLLQRWLAPRLAARAKRTGRLPDAALAGLVGAHPRPVRAGPGPGRWGRCSWTCRGGPRHYLELLVPLALVLQVAAWGHRGIGLWIESQFQAHPGHPATGATRAAVLGFVLRLVLWSLLLLLALDVLGFNITTLVASLGIGGIAVALAVQNILGDLFASLSITLDKPFVIGDFIQVDQCLGVVEFIGLKTTRIHSLSGEQIVIANGDLLKSRIRNYKKMLERRVVFGFAVSHRHAPRSGWRPSRPGCGRWWRPRPRTRFDRAHFFEFTDMGLRFEVVYYVLDPDYNLYMDIQQAINLGLLEAFRQRRRRRLVPGADPDGPGRGGAGGPLARTRPALAYGAEKGTMGAWPTHPSRPPQPPGS